MAPLVGLLVKLAFPVVVDALRKKVADEKPHLYENHTEVPVADVAYKAVGVATLGTLKSKTGWFGLGLVILGYLEANHDLVASIVPPAYSGIAIAAIGAITLFLRGVTTTSLVEKTEPKE